MTITTPDTGTATIEHLDFDHELRCEIENCRHGRPRATWALRMDAQCGCTIFRLCCEPCRARITRTWLALTAGTGPWACSHCRRPVAWPHRLAFRPIQGPRT